jgi:D-3-phosphoglycerate dehydrogenase
LSSKSMPRILISDPLAGPGLHLLQAEADVTVATGLTQDALIEAVPEFDALVVRSATKVTTDVLAAGTRLRVVGRAGVGVDNIDVDEATRRGIVVVNSAGASTIAVAEHAFALLLALARNIVPATRAVTCGDWKPSALLGTELHGKVLGVVGLGRIGIEVARRARAFEMRVVAHDPFVSPAVAGACGAELVELTRLLTESDVVSLHAPLGPSTSGMVDAHAIATMKRGAWLINCARGGLVDEQALVESLDAGHLGAAALDVFATEPLPVTSRLRTHPKVLCTPHIGASTREAQVEVATEVARLVLACLRGEHVVGAVNAPMRILEEIAYLEPYLRLGEHLGRALVQLTDARLDAVEVTYHGEVADHDTGPVTAAVIKGLLGPVSEERVNLINARLVARSRGLHVAERKVEAGDSPYANVVSVEMGTGAARRDIAGAIVGNEMRLVRLDGYGVDVSPAGHVLVTRHLDRPGMIGRVGTILGEGDVNISAMQVGRRTLRGEAVMVMTLDERIGRDVEARLAAIDGILSVKQVTL